jgi:general secretion pathway protein I
MVAARGRAGFTLIEVLTAMMILAIAMVTILQLFSGGLRSAAVAGGYTRAVLHAREKMAELLLYDEMTDASLEGSFADGYRWRADIRCLNPEPDAPSEGGSPGGGAPVPAWPLDLFEISVEVAWKERLRERRFSIQTVHAAKKIEIDDGA